MTWKRWLVNLGNAGISGMGAVFFGNIAGLTLKQVLIMTAGAFGLSAYKWYLQHPPPGVETVTVEKSIEPTSTGVKATTTTTTSTETK